MSCYKGNQMALPHVGRYNESLLQAYLGKQYKNLDFLKKEDRINFNGEFPEHNRYFSNGDKPLVALVNLKGTVHLNYENADYPIPEKHFVFFDDNAKHSWIMKNTDLEIFYYRQKCNEVNNPVFVGDYCIDSMF